MNFPNRERYIYELCRLGLITKELSNNNVQSQVDKDIKYIDHVGRLLPTDNVFTPLTFKDLKKKDRIYISTTQTDKIMRDYSLFKYIKFGSDNDIMNPKILDTLDQWIFGDIVIRTAAEIKIQDNKLSNKMLKNFFNEKIDGNVSYLHFQKIGNDLQVDHYIFSSNDYSFEFEESYYFPEWSINFSTLFYYEFCSKLLSYKSKREFNSTCLIASKETNYIYVPCKFFSNHKYKEMTVLEKRMQAMPQIFEHIHAVNLYLLEKMEDREKTTISVKKNKTNNTKESSNSSTAHIITINDEIKIYSSTKEVIKEFRTRKPCLFEFGVRGHVRHYKSGKTVWIEPYTKNKGKTYGSKLYLESNS